MKAIKFTEENREYSEGTTDYFKTDEPFIKEDSEAERLIKTGFFEETDLPVIDTEDSLKKLTKPELVKKALELNIENLDDLKKDDLIEEILKATSDKAEEIEEVEKLENPEEPEEEVLDEDKESGDETPAE